MTISTVSLTLAEASGFIEVPNDVMDTIVACDVGSAAFILAGYSVIEWMHDDYDQEPD